MVKPLVVVTGKNGQVGWELMQIAETTGASFDFIFTAREELDLGSPASISLFFDKYQPAYFINCAAYTAVDKAETEQQAAYTMNADAVGMIAMRCSKINCTLIHISTDYVFDGKGNAPYQTDTATKPINYYGFTKWMGEKLALENNKRTIIIRTSWIYSAHGNNFVKTMLRLMKERTEVKVVNDQIGSPTYAGDLADAIMSIIQALEKGNIHYGIYHFSNTGNLSWFDFAMAIKYISKATCTILPQPSTAYPTPAKRPAYSVMDIAKIAQDFNIDLQEWKLSLQKAMPKILESF